MRKHHYTILAHIIKSTRESAHVMRNSAGATPEYYDGKISALDFLADRFARETGINRAEFLKACGIDL